LYQNLTNLAVYAIWGKPISHYFISLDSGLSPEMVLIQGIFCKIGFGHAVMESPTWQTWTDFSFDILPPFTPYIMLFPNIAGHRAYMVPQDSMVDDQSKKSMLKTCKLREIL